MMKLLYRYRIILSTILFCLPLFTGCKDDGPYDVVFVSGSVLVDGKPVPHIAVTFSPVNPAEGHAAGGSTDEQGKFVVTTAGMKVGKGAVPGKYNVVFSKQSNTGEGLTLEEYMEKFPRGTAPETIYHIPQKYGSPSTSGIEPVMVEKGKKNEFHFALSAETE